MNEEENKIIEDTMEDIENEVEITGYEPVDEVEDDTVEVETEEEDGSQEETGSEPVDEVEADTVEVETEEEDGSQEETGSEPVDEGEDDTVEVETEEETSSQEETGNEPVKSTNNKNTKIIVIILVVIVLVALVLVLLLGKKDKDNKNSNSNKESNITSNETKELPKPELSGGERGKLGIDKNINEKTIDDYLGREDSVYRDMRMLEDPANYEAIGGDRYLSGYIKGFEVVPLPYILPVSGLPDAVGKTYEGKTLFSIDKNGSYVANYEESRQIIEELFPKDKVIFLMCGGGGYAGMMRGFLISMGWDENKIYNIGGHWYYEGKNNIPVKKVVDGKTVYDFDSVPYHKIEFDKLTSIKSEDEKPKDTAIELTSKYYNNELVTEVDNINYDELYEWYDEQLAKYDYDKMCPQQAEEDEESNENDENLEDSEKDDENGCPAYDDAIAKLETEYDKREELITNKKANVINSLLESKETFIITFDEGHKCGADAENDPRGYMFDIAYKYNIYVYDLGMDVYKKTRLYQTVKYAPGVIIYSNGKIIAYTDAESDEHSKLYESEKAFKEWLTKYIKLERDK
jgi:hypothetical protein